MMRTLTIISICCIVIITACKKDKKVSPAAQKLQNGTWQISAATIVKYKGVDTTINYYNSWRPCEQDDIIMYNDDGTGYSDEYINKCSEDNQTNKFSWELQNNDTQLKMSLNGGKFISTNSNTIIFDLIDITDNQLKLRSDGIVANAPATIIETYTNIK